VRAGLVSDPKNYRWCGYAEAVAGRAEASRGVQALVSALQGREESVSKSLEVYRMHLYLQGNEAGEGIGEDGGPVRGTMSREAAVEVLKAKGRLPMAEYLRRRVRYFCDGAVFGSREFVNEIFTAYRDRFGPRRKTGARRMRGLAEEALYALRDLQKGIFG
jgi:hypothetical protein